MQSGLHGDGAGSFASASSQSLLVTAATLANAGTDFGFACWIRSTTTDTTQQTFFSCDSYMGINLCYRNGAFRPRMFTSSGQENPFFSTTATVNTWSFVVFNYVAATKTLTLSVNDGTKENVVLTGTLNVNTTGSVRIGGGVDFFNGQIDAVGWWPARTLTNAEITTLYNGGNGVAVKNYTGSLRIGIPSGWDMDGPDANLLIDSIGTNTLTNIAAVTYAAGQVSTTSMVDGDAVSQWDDLSGNGRNLVQATASNRPIYKTGIQNNLPSILFDGVDDFLRCTSFVTASQPVSFAAALRAISGDTGFPISFGNNNNGTAFQLRNSNTLFALIDTGTFFTIPLTTVWHAFQGVGNGALSSLVADGATTAGTVGTTGFDGSVTVGRSGLSGSATYVNEYVGELYATTIGWGAAQIAQNQAYLKNKWATP